ncbi:MAG: ABC transporter ATP-binding protein [Fuerstiella sp.]|jgi:NitT/TauT family transport system ATP-binding protein
MADYLVTNSIDTKVSIAELHDVSVRFNTSSPIVLQVQNLTIHSGDFVSVVGASGSGKSTLLRLIAGLTQPTSGTVKSPSSDSSSPAATGMVFQSANLVPWRTAEGNVRLPSELGTQPTQISSDRIDELFQLVGLTTADKVKQASALSGGMQMRISLARALVRDPNLLLMDEPFSALDDLLRMQLEEDVRRIHAAQALTTVLVTHNIAEAVFMSDRVLVLGNRPSTIHKDLKINLTAERSGQLRNTPQFHSAVAEVTDALRSAAAAGQFG